MSQLLIRGGVLFPRRDETAEEMLARTFIAPLSTGVAAIDRCDTAPDVQRRALLLGRPRTRYVARAKRLNGAQRCVARP